MTLGHVKSSSNFCSFGPHRAEKRNIWRRKNTNLNSRPFLLLRISFLGRPIFLQFIPGDRQLMRRQSLRRRPCTCWPCQRSWWSRRGRQQSLTTFHRHFWGSIHIHASLLTFYMKFCSTILGFTQIQDTSHRGHFSNRTFVNLKWKYFSNLFTCWTIRLLLLISLWIGCEIIQQISVGWVTQSSL